MKRSTQDTVVHGLVGGLIAGALVALWFLLLDSIQGHPFRTPELLASSLLGGAETASMFRLVAVYSVLHFAIFALLGAVAAWFLAAVDIAPGVFVGLAFGLGVLNAVYYSVRLISGVNVLSIVPFEHVMVSNALGGLGLMAYLHHSERSERPFGLGVLRGHASILRGLTTGLLGAATVALWFLVIDGVTGQPLETPAALGSALILGATSPAQVQMTWGVIASYTVLHMTAFSIAGLAFVLVAEQIERTPGLWLLFLLAFIVLEAIFVTTIGLLAEWAIGSLGWWAVGAGNVLAVCAMGWWVWRTHPALRARLRDPAVQTQV